MPIRLSHRRIPASNSDSLDPDAPPRPSALIHLTSFGATGASAQVFMVFPGWDLGDPCLAQLINQYKIPQEISTSDVVTFSRTSGALSEWVRETGDIVRAVRDEIAELQGEEEYSAAELKALQSEVIELLDCIPKVGTIIRRMERQLEDLGINTLTLGSDRERRDRQEVFAELNQQLDALEKACQEVLDM